MKKTIFFLAIILLSLNSLSSQQKKHITPTSISFVEKSVISSKRKFEKSIDKFVVKMFKSVINAVEKEDNINIDTKNMINLGKKTVVPLMKSEYKDLVKEYCYKIYNDKVVQFEKQNDKVVGDYKVVNKSTGKYRYLAKKDSITYYGKEQLYTYLNDDVIVKEYRNKTKKIGKINCFKVVKVDDTAPIITIRMSYFLNFSSPKSTISTVLNIIFTSLNNVMFFTYLLSNSHRSSQVKNIFPFTCANPVKPGLACSL